MPTTPLEIVKAFLKAMEPLDYSTAGATQINLTVFFMN